MGVETPRILLSGTKVLWYKIGSVIGQGGFGITYLAEDENLGRQVAIKEYLPLEFAVRESGNTVEPLTGELGGLYRWGLRGFIEEARTLARFPHPNIVHIHNVFEHNNTAYIVMEFIPGEDFSTCLSRQQCNTESELRAIFLPLLAGLKTIHAAGYIHRDITPSNIRIKPDGTPVLIDFGSARDALRQRSRSLTRVATPQFAPFEQYSTHIQQGPWTDIYALGACLYVAVTGRRPVDAMDRRAALLDKHPDPFAPASHIVTGRFSRGFLDAIDSALRFQTQERPQTLDEWELLLLSEEPVSAEEPTAINPDSYGKQPQPAQYPIANAEMVTRVSASNTTVASINHRLIWGGAAAILICAMIFAGFFLQQFDSNESGQIAGEIMSPETEAVEKQDPEANFIALLQQAESEIAIFELETARQFLQQAAGILSNDQRLQQVADKLARQASLRQALETEIVAINADLMKQELDGLSLRLEQMASSLHGKSGLGDLETQRLKLQSAVIDAVNKEKAQQKLVFNQNLAQVKQFIDVSNFTAARQYLDLAGDIYPDHPDLEPLRLAIVQQEARKADIFSLMNKALTLKQKGQYPEALNILDAVDQLDNNSSSTQVLRREILELNRAVKKPQKREVAIKPVLPRCPQGGNDEVATLLYQVKNALSELDLAGLRRVSSFTSATEQDLENLADHYSSLDVKAKGMRFNQTECQGLAAIKITQAVRKNGQMVIPADSWSEFELKFIRQGDQWLAQW